MRSRQAPREAGRDVPSFAVHSHGSHPTNPEAVTLLGTEHQQLHTYPRERFCYQVLQGFSLMGLEDNVIFFEVGTLGWISFGKLNWFWLTNIQLSPVFIEEENTFFFPCLI